MLKLSSPAKLNLYLLIRNRRRDDYHNLTSVFERVDLSDTITLTLRKDKSIKIFCDNPAVPKDHTNLAYKSASILQKTFSVDKGVDIHIKKRIPLGSGMGGGSSNAATVLKGLRRLWGLKVPFKKLVRLSEKIGSDVPFFMYDSSFALVEGRGERVKPLKKLSKVKLWHIIVVPKIPVSTARIYKKWDELGPRLNRLKLLTKSQDSANILILALLKKDVDSVSRVILNSLEPVTTFLYPEVSLVKEKLLLYGLKSILMSGSGPAVFGVVSSKKEAIGLVRQLKRRQRSWQVFTAQTL